MQASLQSCHDSECASQTWLSKSEEGRTASFASPNFWAGNRFWAVWGNSDIANLATSLNPPAGRSHASREMQRRGGNTYLMKCQASRLAGARNVECV